MDEQLMREYIKLKKEEKRKSRTDSIGKLLKYAGKALPKGIRNPNDMVTNMHLYTPMRGKHKTKLF